jgi:hypothetical protein
MKKRQFLTPLALSLAALLSSTAADASLPQTQNTTESVSTSTQIAGSVQASDFVLKPSRNVERAAQYADHYSHYSHESHSSHSSHYSSRY